MNRSFYGFLLTTLTVLVPSGLTALHHNFIGIQIAACIIALLYPIFLPWKDWFIGSLIGFTTIAFITFIDFFRIENAWRSGGPDLSAGYSLGIAIASIYFMAVLGIFCLRIIFSSSCRVITRYGSKSSSKETQKFISNHPSSLRQVNNGTP